MVKTKEAERARPQRSMKTSEWWIGTTADSPLQNVSVNGVTFQKFTEVVKDSDGSFQTKRSPYPGSLVKLVDEYAEEILDRIKHSVVRVSGKQVGCLNTRSENYTPRPHDRPLSDYLYMTRVQDAVKNYGGNWRSREAKPLSSSAE